MNIFGILGLFVNILDIWGYSWIFVDICGYCEYYGIIVDIVHASEYLWLFVDICGCLGIFVIFCILWC